MEVKSGQNRLSWPEKLTWTKNSCCHVLSSLAVWHGQCTVDGAGTTWPQSLNNYSTKLKFSTFISISLGHGLLCVSRQLSRRFLLQKSIQTAKHQGVDKRISLFNLLLARRYAQKTYRYSSPLVIRWDFGTGYIWQVICKCWNQKI